MTDTDGIVKYVAVVSIVAIFAVAIGDWDATAPQVSGWTDFQDALSTDPDPQNDSLVIENFTIPDDCLDPGFFPDLGCIFWPVAWFANTTFSVIVWLAEGAIWIANLVVSFFGALFGSATLTFNDMPPAIQALMWVFTLPMLAMVIISIMRFVRGAG